MAKPKPITSLADLQPDKMNANRGNERGHGMLADSLRELGAGRSILADKNGAIIAGNKTLAVAASIGLGDIIVVPTDGTKLVVVQRTDLDLENDQRAKRLALADNRVGEANLEWDANILAQLQAEDPALTKGLWTEGELAEVLLGVGGELPEAPEAQVDRAAELQAVWQTRTGQLWEIPSKTVPGRCHRLLCDDSTKAEDVQRLMGGEKAAMLHTDPPYGINIVAPKGLASADLPGASKPFGSTGGSNRKSRNQIIQSNIYHVMQGDDGPFDPTPLLGFAPIVILWGANYFAASLPISSCWLCWDKREATTRNSFADCELAWCSKDSPARVFHHLWNGLHKGSQYNERRTHPTEKPVALFEEIGKMYAPNGLWVDLYAGTGAQLLAAERTAAICYAVEIEAGYIAVSLQRLADMGLEPRLCPDG